MHKFYYNNKKAHSRWYRRTDSLPNFMMNITKFIGTRELNTEWTPVQHKKYFWILTITT